MELNYRMDAQIDEDNLDVEVLQQPHLGLAYRKNLATMADKVRRLEEKLKVKRSQLIFEANEKPEEVLGAGIKPTLQVVEAYYRKDKKYRKLKKEWLDAVFDKEIAEGAKDEIAVSKKKSLELMVELFGKGYFVGPNVPHNLHEEVAKRKERSKNMNEGINLKFERKK